MTVKVINKKLQTLFGAIEPREYFMFEGDLYLKLSSMHDDLTNDSYNAVHLESGELEIFADSDVILQVENIKIAII